jgi:hypothetical protein
MAKRTWHKPERTRLSGGSDAPRARRMAPPASACGQSRGHGTAPIATTLPPVGACNPGHESAFIPWNGRCRRT